MTSEKAQPTPVATGSRTCSGRFHASRCRACARCIGRTIEIQVGIEIYSQAQPLALADYEPKSMLQVRETRVERARFPAVDIHTHISVSTESQNGIELAPQRTYLGKADDILPVMHDKNIRAMVNLTGGYDDGLVEVINKYDKAFPGRFFSFTEPCYSRFLA